VLMESVGVNIAFRVDAVKIKEQLDRKVFSQDWATSVVAKRLQLCVADLQDKTKPASSFLFTGSTGVGKSELTKQLAKLMFGDVNKHLIRFDMSEYARDDSLDLFRMELTSRVWHTSHAVLLLDEIEKASPLVTRMLLQVLDDGRLSDANGRQVSFLNTYIVLTTNAGSEIYETIAQYNADDTGSGKQLMEKMKEIRRSIVSTQGDNRFPPELLGRIDAIVPFQPLSRETQRTIVMSKLRGFVQEVLSKHGTRVLVAERVIEYLVEDKGDTDSNAGGARAAIARMTDEVATAVAAFINQFPGERALQVDIRGVLKSEDKDLLKSDAEVVVSLPVLVH
jgi:ATP-dependent Clp protease ATP-binding subunit ClpA